MILRTRPHRLEDALPERSRAANNATSSARSAVKKLEAHIEGVYFQEDVTEEETLKEVPFSREGDP